MSYLVLAVLALVVLYGLGRLFLRADPAKLAFSLRIVSGVLVLVIGAFVTIRVNPAIGLPMIALGLGLLGKSSWLTHLGLPGGGMGRPGRTRSGGQRSRVTTQILAMELDHDTGSMDGEVLSGPLSGRMLSSLTLAELADLHTLCTGLTDQSVTLLEAYLDRTRPDWRDELGTRGGAGTGESRSSSSDGPMSEREALEILGLEPGADDKAIQAAHRRLMKQYHPDRGGSAYLAAKINEAKSVLMGKGTGSR